MTFRPIRRRIAGIVIAAVLLTLAMSAIGIFGLHYTNSRKHADAELRTIAGVLEPDLGLAVNRGDRGSAERILERLRLRSEISQAHIFFPESGDFFASVPADETAPLEALTFLPGVHFTESGAWFVQELRDEQGRPLAMFALQSSLTMVKEERARSIVLLGVVTVLTLVGALVFSNRLQRGLTAPLMSLEKSVQEITQRRERGLRVARTSNDEMGQLADHVNAMLATFERQAQTAEENELAYRVLFDQSPLTVVLTRRNGEIVDVNERGVQELSLERGQIIGKTVESLGLVGADSAPVLSGLLKRSDRRIERLETSIPGAGGRVRHLVISARGVTFHGEELVLMIVQDVTERVLTMEALQQSEKVYREAIEGAGAVPYAKMEHPRHYAFMGDGIEELTGYTSRQMTPDLWNSIIRQVIPLGEALGLGLPEALRRVYARDLHSWKADLLVQTRAGDLRWITDSSVILRDPEGQVLGSVGILTDVSDRKRAEEALQQSEERFRTLVKNLQVIAFAIDTQGVFTLSEGLGLQKLGQRPGQLVGLSVFDVYSSQPEILEHVRKALAGEAVLADLALMGLTFEIRYTPVRDHRGSVTGVIGVAFDITERTRAEEEVRALNLDLERRVQDRTARLEAANRELEAFAYSVSHDLRAPLRAMDGFSEALLEDYSASMDERSRGYAERIRSSAQRMGVLIDGLLRLSRLSRAEINPTEVDLSAMVTAIAAELRESQPGRRAELTIAGGIRVYADPALARIALDNLLQNAWKFTCRREVAVIEFGSQPGPEGEQVCYLRDNGAGFNMAYAGKLFGVFQRLHEQHEFPGSGIGLATVQRILHRHGGEVWAEGAVDRGATIFFRFPDPPREIRDPRRDPSR